MLPSPSGRSHQTIIMAKVLTVKAVENLKAGATRREVPDAHTPGLYLVIQPSGRKSWAVRTRHAGKPLKITLKALELVKARAEAVEIIETVRAGKDPRTVAADREAARPAAFAEIVDQYIERYAKPRKRTWLHDQQDLGHLLPLWGKRTAAEITRRDVLAVIEAKAKEAPVRANRLLAVLRKLFNWAVQVDLLPASPAVGIKPPTKEKSRDRVLSDAELAAFWRAADAMGEPWTSCFRTLALTLQRLGEVTGMTRQELDLDSDKPLWTLAAGRVKAGPVHDVPLVQEVVALVRAMPEIVVDGKPSPLVFTFTGRPLSALSAAKRRVDGLMKLELGEDFQDWRLHDLRRTGASNLARMGVAIHVVAALLNHSPGSTMGITAVYARHRYTEEKRRALEAWTAHVLGLVEDRASNVVRIA